MYVFISSSGFIVRKKQGKLKPTNQAGKQGKGVKCIQCVSFFYTKNVHTCLHVLLYFLLGADLIPLSLFSPTPNHLHKEVGDHTEKSERRSRERVQNPEITSSEFFPFGLVGWTWKKHGWKQQNRKKEKPGEVEKYGEWIAWKVSLFLHLTGFLYRKEMYRDFEQGC